MKTKNLRIKRIALTVISLFMIGLSSCKSDDETTVLECFDDAYNGTYTGTGTIDGETFAGDLVFTKLSCTTAKYEADGFTENINDLSASAGGGFTGKTDEGEGIALSLSGNTISISGGSGTNFTGTK